MDDDRQWLQLITGLRDGDQRICADFYARYRPLLERLASKNLESGVLRRTGPEDVAHSACRTFLRRVHGGQFDLDGDDSLWNLLCAITVAKARKKARFHLAKKRGLDREATSGAPDADPTDGLAAWEPSPADAVEFADQFEHLLSDLDDEARRMVCLRLESRTQEEIADALGCSERTVRRILARVQTQLARAVEGLR